MASAENVRRQQGIWTDQLSKVFAILSKWHRFETQFVCTVLGKVRDVYEANNRSSLALGFANESLLGLMKASNQVKAAHIIWRLVLANFDRSITVTEEEEEQPRASQLSFSSSDNHLQICRLGLEVLNQMSRPILSSHSRPRVPTKIDISAAHKLSLTVMRERQVIAALSMFSLQQNDPEESNDGVLLSSSLDSTNDASLSGLSVLSHILSNHEKLLLIGDDDNDDSDRSKENIETNKSTMPMIKNEDDNSSHAKETVTRDSAIVFSSDLGLRASVMSAACLLLWNVSKDNPRVQRACLQHPPLLAHCLALMREPFVQRSVDESNVSNKKHSNNQKKHQSKSHKQWLKRDYHHSSSKHYTILVYHAMGALISLQSSMISVESRDWFALNGGVDSVCVLMRHPLSLFRQMSLYYLRSVASTHSALHWYFVKCLNLEHSPSDGIALLCSDLCKFANDRGVERMALHVPSFRFVSSLLRTLLAFVSTSLARNVDAQLSFDQGGCDAKAMFLRLFELMFDCEQHTRAFLRAASDARAPVVSESQRWPTLNRDLAADQSRSRVVLARLRSVFRSMLDVLSQFEVNSHFIAEQCEYLIPHQRMTELRAAKELRIRSAIAKSTYPNGRSDGNSSSISAAMDTHVSGAAVTAAGVISTDISRHTSIVGANKDNNNNIVSDSEAILRARWKRQVKVQKGVLRIFLHSRFFVKCVLFGFLKYAPIGREYTLGTPLSRHVWHKYRVDIEMLHSCVACLSTLISVRDYSEYFDNELFTKQDSLMMMKVVNKVVPSTKNNNDVKSDVNDSTTLTQTTSVSDSDAASSLHQSSSSMVSDNADTAKPNMNVSNQQFRLNGLLFLFELGAQPSMAALFDTSTLQWRIRIHQTLTSLCLRSKSLCRFIGGHSRCVRSFTVMLVSLLMAESHSVAALLLNSGVPGMVPDLSRMRLLKRSALALMTALCAHQPKTQEILAKDIRTPVGESVCLMRCLPDALERNQAEQETVARISSLIHVLCFKPRNQAHIDFFKQQPRVNGILATAAKRIRY